MVAHMEAKTEPYKDHSHFTMELLMLPQTNMETHIAPL